MFLTIVIPADLTQPVRREWCRATLPELQAIVGGYLEAVQLPGATMFLDEEGKLEGLPSNPRATTVCRVMGAMGADFVVGDVAVLGWDPAGDVYSDCPQPLAEFIEGLGVLGEGL